MQQTISATEGPRAGNDDDVEYDDFLARLQARFTKNLDGGKRPLFTTDAEGLWQTYIGTFIDPSVRQYHTCHACRHFIERFGGLATIDEDGTIASAIWNENDAPPAYKPAIALLAKAVRRAKVTGAFRSSDARWGQPVTGKWQHLSVAPPKGWLFVGRTLSAEQKMAELRENFGTVSRALAAFR